jgi:hypothetical protein
MKERLTQQLLDVYLRAYLEKKELWIAQHFERIGWTHYIFAFKQLLKGRHTVVLQAIHNL